MTFPSRRHWPVYVVASALLAAAVWLGPRADVSSGDPLPTQLSDRAFWKMIGDFSEPAGFFRSDNLISNESTFQHVIPTLQAGEARRLVVARQRPVKGGVYIGVGPDQNFTYVAALKPGLVFIIDIRRQNLLLHLMYKAMIEMSEDRADFLSRLFSRARPVGLERTSSPEALFEAFNGAAADESLFQKNLQAVLDRLTKHHGFTLSRQDTQSIEYVDRAFFVGGPELRYSFPRQFGGRWFPSYAELMLETDEEGARHSYLATDAYFQALRTMERRNLIVPLTGDFGGDKTIRAVGRYLKEHGATVAWFYTSNVEQYLFQSDAWKRFFGNVATLPLDEHGTFIRAFFNMGARYPSSSASGQIRSATLLEPIADAIAAFRDGRIQTYYDVIERSK
jgi:hypothetical protein